MQPCQVVDSLWSASRGFAAVEAAPSEKGIFGIPQMGFYINTEHGPLNIQTN